MKLGLIEFLLISGVVLALALFELVPLKRERRRHRQGRKNVEKPPL